MVLDDGGRPALERFERAELGRPIDHLEIERLIETPPDELEDLLKRRRGSGWRRHPAREGEIKMMVGADESRSGIHLPRRAMGSVVRHFPSAS